MLNDIPGNLKQLKQWVCHIDKVPVIAGTGRHASSTNPDTWSSYEEALDYHMVGMSDGIGFVFTRDDLYIGIDIDHCRDPITGEIDKRAMDMLDLFPNCYVEVSMSGTGLHIIVMADIPKAIKVEGLEIYGWGRYFIMTGDILPGYSSDILYMQDSVDIILRSAAPTVPTKVARSTKVSTPKSAAVPSTELLPLSQVLPGSRNTLLFYYGRLYASGKTLSDIYEYLTTCNSQLPVPLEAAEISKIAHSIVKGSYKPLPWTDQGRALAKRNKVRNNTNRVIAAVVECRASGIPITTKRIADMSGLNYQTIQRSYYKLLE
jgi:hypothetical protein